MSATPPRDEIAAALAADDSQAALRILRAAIAWSARSAEEARRDPEEVAAVEAVVLLDDALSEAERLVREIPGLLDAAQLGSPVERHLLNRSRDLSEIGESVANARAAHEELARSERARRARLEELSELRERIGELRRLERLVRALDDLEAQRRIIDERVASLTASSGDIEGSIGRGSAELLRLTEDALSALAPRTRELLERSISAQKALSEEEERNQREEAGITEAAERIEQLRETREQRLASHRVHLKANRDLVEALFALGDLPADVDRSALELARGILDEVEGRLRDVDEALCGVLDTLDEARERHHAVIPWSEAAESRSG